LYKVVKRGGIWAGIGSPSVGVSECTSFPKATILGGLIITL